MIKWNHLTESILVADPIKTSFLRNDVMTSSFVWRAILSENRYALFPKR